MNRPNNTIKLDVDAEIERITKENNDSYLREDQVFEGTLTSNEAARIIGVSWETLKVWRRNTRIAGNTTPSYKKKIPILPFVGGHPILRNGKTFNARVGYKAKDVYEFAEIYKRLLSAKPHYDHPLHKPKRKKKG